MQATESFAASSPEAMARIVEGLITGVGFIGGGAILKNGNSVHGTATAASLWVTGAIGVAAGLGSYDVAVVLSLTTLVTLLVLSRGSPDPGMTTWRHDAVRRARPRRAASCGRARISGRADRVRADSGP